MSLQVVCITVFKKGGSRELYSWHVSLGYDYWPLWAREVGAMLQLLPLLTVPVVAVIQTCRYISAGPPDIFEVRRPSQPELLGATLTARRLGDVCLLQDACLLSLSTAGLPFF